MEKVVTPMAPTARTTEPKMTIPRTPNLSNRRPESKPQMAPMTAPGSMSRPETVAVCPMTC